MDAFTNRRAENVAHMLNMAMRNEYPLKPLVKAKQDEVGRWSLPGIYDTSAIPGEEHNATLWRILASLHNADPGLELADALPICRALMGEKPVNNTPALRQMAGMIRLLLQIFYFHVDLIDPSYENTLNAAAELAQTYEKG